VASGFAGTIIVVQRPTSWVELATTHFTAAYSLDAMTLGASLADRAVPPAHGEPASSSAGAASLDRSPAASALCDPGGLPSSDDADGPDPASGVLSAGGCSPPSVSALRVGSPASSPLVVPGDGSNGWFVEAADDPQLVAATPRPIALHAVHHALPIVDGKWTALPGVAHKRWAFLSAELFDVAARALSQASRLASAAARAPRGLTAADATASPPRRGSELQAFVAVEGAVEIAIDADPDARADGHRRERDRAGGGESA